MRILFSEVRIRPLIVGILKYSDLIAKLMPVSAGATSNSRYCYAVWFRHLNYLAKQNGGEVPEVVAELGPGDSIGVGLAALLSGSETYFAMDGINYWNKERNIRVFHELLTMFRNKEMIPDKKEFPLLFPEISDYGFPFQMLTPELLEESLSENRVRKICEEISNPGNKNNRFIKTYAPWNNSDIIQNDSVDFIFSQSALEQVNTLEEAYASMQLWMRRGGYMSHVIDYKSLGMTKTWNGHLTFKDWEWEFVKGGRKFAINREPHSVHVRLHKQNGFEVISEINQIQGGSVKREKLAPRFAGLPDSDLTISTSFILSRKV